MECQQGGGELILVWQFGDQKNGLRCETKIMSRAKQKMQGWSGEELSRIIFRP